jgi:hypothetical protein
MPGSFLHFPRAVSIDPCLKRTLFGAVTPSIPPHRDDEGRQDQHRDRIERSVYKQEERVPNPEIEDRGKEKTEPNDAGRNAPRFSPCNEQEQGVEREAECQPAETDGCSSKDDEHAGERPRNDHECEQGHTEPTQARQPGRNRLHRADGHGYATPGAGAGPHVESPIGTRPPGRMDGGREDTR